MSLHLNILCTVSV